MQALEYIKRLEQQLNTSSIDFKAAKCEGTRDKETENDSTLTDNHGYPDEIVEVGGDWSENRMTQLYIDNEPSVNNLDIEFSGIGTKVMKSEVPIRFSNF